VARAPFTVHVLPYRRIHSNFEFAVLRRSDGPIWQGIAGGGEDDETPLETARRESFEECGINHDARFLKLDSLTMIPVTYFRFPPGEDPWGDEVYVIPQYPFGVDAAGCEIVLSHEHTEYRWLAYEAAYELLHFQNTKYNLWELHQRLKGLGPRG